jgi:hypothetical protein
MQHRDQRKQQAVADRAEDEIRGGVEGRREGKRRDVGDAGERAPDSGLRGVGPQVVYGFFFPFSSYS